MKAKLLKKLRKRVHKQVKIKTLAESYTHHLCEVRWNTSEARWFEIPKTGETKTAEQMMEFYRGKFHEALDYEFRNAICDWFNQGNPIRVSSLMR